MKTTSLLTALASLIFFCQPLAAQDPGGAPRVPGIVIQFIGNEAAAAEPFIEAELDAHLRKRVAPQVLSERLQTLRGLLENYSLDEVFPEGPRCAGMVFESPQGDLATLLVTWNDQSPGRITDLWIEAGFRLDPDAAPEVLPAPLTWENLKARMQLEVEAGFAGSLLIVRDGKVKWNEGYGMANREEQIACTPKTIYAVGSVPIDFTKAAILLLIQDELVDYDQPLTDFFEDVPGDKQSITLGHLMGGQSGLQDFLGLPSDSDIDHHWIDREEAIRRIMAHELLFKPGTERRHSHAAWGLVAAIVELVSGLSYQEFTQEMLFAPAGMLDTGFYGEPIPKERLAIGYGSLSSGERNAPPYWGPTSWLVLGSGGMTSTTGDLYRWQVALRKGLILSPQSARRYWSGGGVLSAGDSYGFEVNYTEEPERLFVLLSNAIEGPMRRRFNRLGRELLRLP